jgi:hypothetical protein
MSYVGQLLVFHPGRMYVNGNLIWQRFGDTLLVAINYQ